MPYNPNSDWRTTKGNIAPDAHWSGADDAAAAHAQLKAEVERNYSGAVVIGTATRNYNCHAFVHASSHAWFNDIGPFLRDDYYQFTPGNLQINDAVVYVKDGQITHSGLIVQLAGNSIIKVRSKWGAWPLIEHPPTSVPSSYGSIMYYLRRRNSAIMGVSEMAVEASIIETQGLINAMLENERLKELWLASTPDVAETIVRGWPEFLELQIRGGISTESFKEKIEGISSDGQFVLSVLAKNSSDPELKVIGMKFLTEQSILK